MERKININGRSYKMKASVLTLVSYKTKFGEDFATALGDVQKQLTNIQKNQDDVSEIVRIFGEVIDKVTKMAYVMIREADKEFSETYEEWVSQIDCAFDEMGWISEVEKLGFTIFRGNTEK